VYEHGPLFWVNAIYSYVLLLGGVFILIRSLLVSRNPIRGQVFVLLAAIAVPLVGNGLYITGYNPFPQFDLTPLAFLFSGLAVSWAFYRYRLLDVMPVVHAALVANLQDGLIVLDSRRRIVELNPAAEEVFAQPGAELIGRDVTDLDWGGSHILELLVKSEAKLEIAIGVGENKRYYDLRSSPLKDRLGNENGRLIVLRDITDQVKAGESLDRSEAILEVVSFAAASFLSTQSWEEAILEVLERFGKAAEVSRAYIFENRFDKQGVVLTSQRFEWAAEGIEPQIDNPELQNFSFQENGMGRWQQLLSSNQLVHGLTSSFPKQEQPLLLSEQIQSIVVAPIFAGQQWWGMIGLDECTYPRHWTRGEIDALEAAAGLIGSSIQRQKSEEAVRQRANEMATLHEVSLVINSPHDLPDLLNAIVERAVTLLGGTISGVLDSVSTALGAAVGP
jgi:PAS domain S-box-containing protein